MIALQILALAAANGAAALGAHELVRKFRSGRASTDAVLFLFLHLLIVSTAVLALGLLRRLDWITAGIAGGVALIGLGARGAFGRLPAPVRPPWPTALLFFLGLVGARLLAQTVAFSPHFCDVISYMLPKVAIWVQSGTIGADVGVDPRGWFPSGFELVETWWVFFLRHDALIELAGIEFLALGFAATYSLSKDLACSDRAAAIAATCFILVTGIHLQATGSTNDGPVAVMVVATAALLRSNAVPALAVSAALLGVGIKPTYAYALPGLLVLAVLFRRGRPTDPTRPVWFPTGKAEIGVALSALVLGGFWYLRNWAVWGNPIHPMEAAGIRFGDDIVLQRLGPSLPVLAANVREIADVRVYDFLRSPDLTGNYMLNWGAATFALGFPGAILWARADRAFRGLAIGLLVSAASVLSQVMTDAGYARFILFLAVVPALAIGRLCETHRAAAVALPVVLALQFGSTMFPDDLWDDQLQRALRGRPIFAREELSDVGCYATSEAGDYLFYRSDFSARVAYLKAGSLDELLREMERHRVAAFSAGRLTRAQDRALQDGLATGRLVKFPASGRTAYRRAP